MDAVFKQFDIKARIYDIDSNLIYKHDPKDFYSKNIIMFNGLVKNSHIYTLNHDLVRLKANPNVEDVHKLKIHSNYYTSSRETHIKYKMIENLDDIFKLKLILKDNDLDKAVFELKQIGYEPQIGHTAGRTTEVKMDFTHQIGKKQKNVYYSIVNQNFDRDRIDEDIAVDEGEVYNNISEEMF